MLRGHGRYDYSGITQRADYGWPDGRRLAVYIALNLEHFSFGEGDGAILAPSGQPDVLNYSWRDYGNRVGAWRLLSLFQSLNLPASLLVNSSLYDHCPDLLAAYRQRGDCFVAHGRTNSERQGGLPEEKERELIAETTQTISRQEGGPPTGWLSPWISESPVTPDLLAEAGYRYLLDWSCDDQPIWMRSRGGPILAVPYPEEVNDIPAIAVRRASAADFAAIIVDQFDEMQRQSSDQPLVMGIALHAFLVGQPFRLKHLRRALQHLVDKAGEEVWFTTTDAVAAHTTALPPGIVPGSESTTT